MNVKEVLGAFLLANIPEIITQEEFDDVKKAIRELQQENQQLKEEVSLLDMRTDENIKLQNNWNELKKGLQSLFEFDYGVVSKDYLECAEDTLEKMQELEQVK